jgi:gluconate:H+ symporter, GntP family
MLVDYPLVILAIGIVTVLGLILALRVNAFIALITAAIVVSLLGPPAAAGTDRMKRVGEAFGVSAGNIGIVIALAAIIGQCMMESGAADRIVRAFLRLLGEKRASFAMAGSGYVLSIPVFFDTVFYLLVPLARSLYRRTGRNYLMYLLAIAAGGAATHSLVPPTPGPLLMADQLQVNLGTMILIGALVALPATLAGIAFAILADRLMPVPMRSIGGRPDPEPLDDAALPPLVPSLLPILLPVLLISADTIAQTLAKAEGDVGGTWTDVRGFTAIVGNPGFALLVSMVVALVLYWRQRRPTLNQMSDMVETSLMSGGTIILITAGGGAFGAMLKTANIGDAIQQQFTGGASGLTFLLLGFGVSVLLKIAQGSSTVAMITASSMLAAMIHPANAEPVALGFHPVYLATAIGGGALCGSWMNDSGFWIFSKMGGLTEVETLRSWTPLLTVLGTVAFLVTLLLASVMPLV